MICGHIHHAEMREIHGLVYINDGDWVESCTAAVERHDGRMELIDWARLRGETVRAARPVRAGALQPAVQVP